MFKCPLHILILLALLLLPACIRARQDQSTLITEDAQIDTSAPYPKEELQTIIYAANFPDNKDAALQTAIQRDLRKIREAGFNSIFLSCDSAALDDALLRALKQENMSLVTNQNVGEIPIFCLAPSPNRDGTNVLFDTYRRPHEAYYLHKSQISVEQAGASPFIYIANRFYKAECKEVKVYSNCQEVELIVNGQPYGRQRPDSNYATAHLQQAPFTFMLDDFRPGKIIAQGFINDEMLAATERHTPRSLQRLNLHLDEQQLPTRTGGDLVVLHADLVDEQGTIWPESGQKIVFEIKGDAHLLGTNPAISQAGRAAIFLQTGQQRQLELTAYCADLPSLRQTIYLKLQNSLSDEKQ